MGASIALYSNGSPSVNLQVGGYLFWTRISIKRIYFGVFTKERIIVGTNLIAKRLTDDDILIWKMFILGDALDLYLIAKLQLLLLWLCAMQGVFDFELTPWLCDENRDIFNYANDD